jgi:hypothetical protein
LGRADCSAFFSTKSTPAFSIVSGRSKTEGPTSPTMNKGFEEMEIVVVKAGLVVVKATA